MKQKIFLWDYNGTITRSSDPDDQDPLAHVILPGVAAMMDVSLCNVVISGSKQPFQEIRSFDENIIMKQFAALMVQLPIDIVAFSPWAGGIACFVMIERKGDLIVKEMHKDSRYKAYIGKFKKPDIGMFIVIRDLVWEEFGYSMNAHNALMIGDMQCDEEGAKNFGIPFMHVDDVHQNMWAQKLLEI